MSNEAKHIPGPFAAHQQQDGLWTVRSTSTGQRVAKDMFEGDALKLAAAPELLEACRAIVAHRDWMISLGGAKRELSPDLVKRLAAVTVDIHAQVESAIAKATGGKK